VRLVIDLQGAQGENRERGIGRYALQLTLAIIRQSGRHDIRILLNAALETETSDLQRRLFEDLCPKSVTVWSPSERSYRRVLADLAPDVVLVTSLFEAMHRPDGPAITDLPTAVVAYDLIPLVLRDRYLDPDPAMERWYFGTLAELKRADLLLAISERTRQDCLTHLSFPEQRAVTIGAGVDPSFRRIEIPFEEALALRRALGLDRPFLLYVGGIDARKNIEGLIDAFAALPAEVRRRHQLAVVCAASDPDRDRLLRRAAEAGLPPGALVMTGAVSDEVLISLYNLCRLFVFPSLYEGFGLPPAEAMACGAPVIASSAGSLPEVIGRSDALFPPDDQALFGARLLAGLVDDAWRADLVSHGVARVRSFTWDAVGQRALAAIEQRAAERRAGKPKPKPSTRRPRLAYVSPMPPAQTGVADYSAELLPALSRHYEVVLVKEAAWLDEHDGEVDRILYHVGNSDHHSAMFGLLDRHPGVMVLHDVYLGHILSHRDRTGEDPGGWARALYQSHGYRALSGDREDAVLRYPACFAQLAAARGTIVHSAFAKAEIGRWFPAVPADSVQIIPHLRAAVEQPDRAGARAALGLAEDEFILCSFGMTGPLKLNHRLVDAFLASDLHKHGRLVLVGANDPGDYGAALLRQIAASRGRITLTGHVGQEVYRHWLAAADGAVQLRAASRGETSGGVLDCLNHGLPTVVNAHGAWADMPPEALRKIADDFTDADLAMALEELWQDGKARTSLGKAARRLIRRDHAPKRIAQLYAETIERFYRGGKREIVPQPALLVDVTEPADPTLLESWLRTPPAGWRIEPVRRRGGLYWLDRQRLSKGALADAPMNAHAADKLVTLSELSPRSLQRQLFVDISELVVADAKTGIQRVVRTILRQWLDHPPPGWRIEPVYASTTASYRYARRFLAGTREDEPIRPEQGDLFLGLDLQPVVVPHNRKALADLRRKGVRQIFVAYDLLCVERPEWFLPGADKAFADWLNTIADADGILCISAEVERSVRRWLEENRPDALETIALGHFRLGGDFAPVEPIEPWDETPPGPVILLVGTLEPRKGHAIALAAAEKLWGEGEDFSLVMVGKAGWLTERLTDYIRRHPELGRRLFWFAAADDRLLDGLYRAADGVLNPSEGEGFGLPLVEAARHDLPVLARDLPIFREVAGEHVRYFAEDLNGSWRAWLADLRNGTAIRSGGIPAYSWAQSAQELLDKALSL
jgi:glycosyltransferase involved in cell wall biosynthesis